MKLKLKAKVSLVQASRWGDGHYDPEDWIVPPDRIEISEELESKLEDWISHEGNDLTREDIEYLQKGFPYKGKMYRGLGFADEASRDAYLEVAGQEKKATGWSKNRDVADLFATGETFMERRATCGLVMEYEGIAFDFFEFCSYQDSPEERSHFRHETENFEQAVILAPGSYSFKVLKLYQGEEFESLVKKFY